MSRRTSLLARDYAHAPCGLGGDAIAIAIAMAPSVETARWPAVIND